MLAALLSGTAAAALWDDLGHGRRWFRRALLPTRPTWNVVAEAGDAAAERTVLFVAHHDAAHSGLVFHPALGRLGPRFMPRLHERTSHTLPILYGVWLGPVIVCAAALPGRRRGLRIGGTVAAGALAAMTDIGLRAVVPGANDNLAAVGVVLAIAERLRRQPLSGLRVVLLSTGSEESFSEGMLRMRDYPPQTREELAAAARAAGVELRRGLRTVGASDALIALRAGYPVATLASVDYTKLPLNYHWPSDTPDALHWKTIEDAIDVCEQFVRTRAQPARDSRPRQRAGR